MNGGGNTARYYVSGSYLDQQGMYKVDKALKDYNTNANFRRWNYRMNVDIDITKSTLLKVGVSGSLQKANDSGVGSDAIWTALMGYNAIMVPKLYSNGYVPAYGNDNGDRFNPWVQATMTGYRENWKNNIQTNVTLEQKLDFITKGLRFVDASDMTQKITTGLTAENGRNSGRQNVSAQQTEPSIMTV